MIILLQEPIITRAELLVAGHNGLNEAVEHLVAVELEVAQLHHRDGVGKIAREVALIDVQANAHDDGMTIVKEFPKVKGVFHCYSGSAEMARQLVDKGWYIGFTGVLTFKNARKAVEVAQSIPLERIVLETDCPYMAPEPFRGKRNDPGKLIRMAEKLAQLRGLSTEEAARITLENGKRLYRIP